MRGRRALLTGVLVLLGSAAVTAVALAQEASGPAKRKKKPTEVDIVQSVPLNVTLPGTPLPVTISSLPRSTHIGQRVEDFVVLELINPMTAPKFVRCNDDGTRDTTEFAVPAGSKLVVTDVDWVVTASFLNSYATLRLFVENRTSSARCLAFLQTGRTTSEEPTGSGGSQPGFGTTGMLSGFVVGANARVVADLRTTTEAVNAGTAVGPITNANSTVVLRGYLTAASQ